MPRPNRRIVAVFILVGLAALAFALPAAAGGRPYHHVAHGGGGAPRSRRSGCHGDCPRDRESWHRGGLLVGRRGRGRPAHRRGAHPRGGRRHVRWNRPLPAASGGIRCRRGVLRLLQGRSEPRVRAAPHSPGLLRERAHRVVPGRSRSGPARLISTTGFGGPERAAGPCLYPWCRGRRAARHVRHRREDALARALRPDRRRAGRRPRGPVPRLQPHQGRPERRRLRRAGGRHGRDRRGGRLRVHTPADRDVGRHSSGSSRRPASSSGTTRSRWSASSARVA